ncbi:hypothetical protein GGX14DRAFT_407303 [Mycena pura]|uniref:Uncharacterized protein n=1 Tax=Mycena pura TaxID=153505 RepID=A0AAD6UQ09_9AGAR|nr:hypothetical protein GGX14DRAFT_407303 [Mycena pura]
MPPASTGSSLVAIGESLGCWSNAKYGCLLRMMRSEPGRNSAQLAKHRFEFGKHFYYPLRRAGDSGVRTFTATDSAIWELVARVGAEVYDSPPWRREITSCPRAFTARSFTAECGTRRRLTTRAQRKRHTAATWSRAKFGGAASATSPTARSASLWCVARTRPLTAELAHTQTLHVPQNIAPMLIIVRVGLGHTTPTSMTVRGPTRPTATRSLAFAPAASESVHGCGSSLDEGGVQLTDIGVAMYWQTERVK